MNSAHRLLIYNAISRFIPTPFFALRRWLLRLCGVQVGEGVKIHATVYFSGGGKFIIGDRCSIEYGCYLAAGGKNGCISIGNDSHIFQKTILSANGGSKLTIGKNCQIAHMISLKTSTHHIEPMSPCIAGADDFRDIEIKDGCWIGAGVIVLPGVSIGRKNVLAAGAVITKDTPDLVLMAGVPAEVKKRYPGNVDG